MYRLGCILLVGFVSLTSVGCVATPMTMSGGYCGSGCGPVCDVGCDAGCDSGCSTACSTGCNFQPCDQFLTGGLLDTGCQEGCGFGSRLAGVASLTSCRGACDEVYVDEWINETPVADHCGYGCDCQACQRPFLTVLKRLWGRRYVAACDNSFFCGGCDSCYAGGAVSEGCGCADCQPGAVMEGGSYAPDATYMEPYIGPSTRGAAPMPYAPQPGAATPSIPSISPEVLGTPPAAQPAGPEASPTMAPQVSPTSRRINPAARRRGYST